MPLTAAEILLRRDKGSALLRDELDDNFDRLRVFANSVEEAAATAQATADSAVADAEENKNLIDALTEALQSLSPSDQPPPNVTVNYNGSRIFRSAVQPVAPPEGFKVNDLWVRTGESIATRFRYWDGAQWVVDPIAIDTIDLAVGLIGIEPVDELPAPGNPPRVVYLTTDQKLYTDKGDHWSEKVPASDIEGELAPINFGDRTITGDKLVFNAIDAGHLNVGIITGSHLVVDQAIITQQAQMAAATVNDAAIVDLSAEKIKVGKLAAVDIAHTGGLYDVAHPDKVFRSITWQGSWEDDHNFGAIGSPSFGFSHIQPVILRGVGHPGGVSAVDNWGPGPMAVKNGEIQLLINAQIHDYSGRINVYYEKNGDGIFTPIFVQERQGNPHANTGFFFRRLSGFTNEDEIKIYAAPADISGNLEGDAIQTRYVLTVLSLNW